MQIKGSYRLKKVEYTVYMNDSGVLELWHSIGRDKKKSDKGDRINNAHDYNRIITNVSSIDQLDKFFTERPKIPEYNPYKDPNQMRIDG